ncbi:Outer membrane protein OmpA [Desulfuromusa kysingii]|uniref:Outer membrane protein OmpA n=1 Tax=Desulfuromusa kysingii TaxID=37625 RepID=A0A1H3W5Q1_9BACT|nr:OmpA family protein [Desulfuromusa kysingii]SDZ81618.1 Outer membrane protein OmpA [Desulfuromusa kysingii]
MNKIRYFIAAIGILMLTLSPVLASGQDCGALKNKIKKERNLLKKRELLNHALEVCPQDAEIHYSCAYAAERLRNYDKAQRNYLKATELDNTYAKAYFGLGDIYMVLGNARLAIDAYEKGLSLAPQNKRARASYELARIKNKSETGEQITSAEFIQVMQESKSEETAPGAVDGPLLRMQIHFYSASSQLSEQAKAQLLNVGKALEDSALQDKKFEISGHTDNVGGEESNLVLSKHRAEQVRQYLLDTFSIHPEALIVAYYGDTRPAVPNTSTENRALNRRVEFRRISQ